MNSANQVHCVNRREKLIRIVCCRCDPALRFMSYSEEVAAEYKHLIYFVVMHSDEWVLNTPQKVYSAVDTDQSLWRIKGL